MHYIPNTPNEPCTRVQWMWNSNADPFSKSESNEWRLYSDVENMIIEKAYTTGKTHAMLDDYHVDLEQKLQISNNDVNKQRPVKRIVCGKDDRHVRVERFLPNPVAPDRPFGGQYGFISPFIKEVVKDLNITKKQLPSKDETIVPAIVEKAARGIIEEGKKIGKQIQAEYIANLLRSEKESGIEDVWKFCAYVYTLDSFLQRKLNETMRLIGSEQHEQIWRSKIGTLGPFGLLLWDNPLNNRITKPGTILYRGASLPDDLITSFLDDCSKDPRPWHSFQAFTSCTRNRNVAEIYGNVLFIMETKMAFTVDIQSISQFPEEEEELLFPGVSFSIDQVECEKDKKKYLIHVTLQQRRNRSDRHHLNLNSFESHQKQQVSTRDGVERDCYADRYDYHYADRLTDRTTYPDPNDDDDGNDCYDDYNDYADDLDYYASDDDYGDADDYYAAVAADDDYAAAYDYVNTYHDQGYRYDLESYAILDVKFDDYDDATNYDHHAYYRDGLDDDWKEY